MGNSGKCIHYGEKVANMTKHVPETHGYTTIMAQKKKKKEKKVILSSQEKWHVKNKIISILSFHVIIKFSSAAIVVFSSAAIVVFPLV